MSNRIAAPHIARHTPSRKDHVGYKTVFNEDEGPFVSMHLNVDTLCIEQFQDANDDGRTKIENGGYLNMGGGGMVVGKKPPRDNWS